MPTLRVAKVVLDGHTYMVRWPAGMEFVMEQAMDQRINRSGAWQGKPGIMLVSRALQFVMVNFAIEALSDV